MEDNNKDFCGELRDKTKVIHDQSDKLINLKLAVVLTDTQLYGKVLADFYHVFQAIEKGIDEARDHPHVWPLFKQFTEGMSRVDAFQKDLNFYLGHDWKTEVTPSDAAVRYCDRVLQVAAEDPTLLIAYAHSMCLALLAGGQIIKKIVKKTLGLSGPDGLDVFEFPDKLQRQELRKRFIQAINEIPLDRQQKDAIIKEKIRCFQMNNAIANSVQPSIKNFGRISKFLLAIFVIFMLIAFIIAHLYVYLSK